MKKVGMVYLLLGTCLGLLVALVTIGMAPEVLATWLVSEKRPGALEFAAVAALATVVGGIYYVLSRRPSRGIAIALSTVAVAAMFFGVPFMLLWLIPVLMLNKQRVMDSDA